MIQKILTERSSRATHKSQVDGLYKIVSSMEHSIGGISNTLEAFAEDYKDTEILEDVKFYAESLIEEAQSIIDRVSKIME